MLISFSRWRAARRADERGVSPPGLDDPVALRTGWRPAKSGGDRHRTHRLVQADASRLEFRSTRWARARAVSVFLIGVTATAALGTGSVREGFRFYLMLWAVAFTVIGAGWLYSGVAPVVFDKREGRFWKARVAPYESRSRRALRARRSLSDIHAIQVLSEFVESDEEPYHSYELNLVLSDGERLNVADHDELEPLRREAHALGDFLERPVWDATAG